MVYHTTFNHIIILQRVTGGVQCRNDWNPPFARTHDSTIVEMKMMCDLTWRWRIYYRIITYIPTHMHTRIHPHTHDIKKVTVRCRNKRISSVSLWSELIRVWRVCACACAVVCVCAYARAQRFARSVSRTDKK